MKLNLILKILSIEIILDLELKTNQSLMKELCFKFLSRIVACTLMKPNLILKVLPTAIIFTFYITTKENVMKMLCFVFLSRILTCTLTLRRRITQIYVFQLPFRVFKFGRTFCKFQKLEVSSSDCALNFQYNGGFLCHLKVLVCCCTASEYSDNIGLFSKLLKKSAQNKG